MTFHLMDITKPDIKIGIKSRFIFCVEFLQIIVCSFVLYILVFVFVRRLPPCPCQFKLKKIVFFQMHLVVWHLTAICYCSLLWCHSSCEQITRTVWRTTFEPVMDYFLWKGKRTCVRVLKHTSVIVMNYFCENINT